MDIVILWGVCILLVACTPSVCIAHNETIIAIKLPTCLPLQCHAVQDTTPVVQSGPPKSITVEVRIHDYDLGRHHVARTPAAVTLVLHVLLLYEISDCGTGANLRFSEPLYTMQDSFKSCTTFPSALHVLQILAPDLIARLHEDHQVSSSMD